MLGIIYIVKNYFVVLGNMLNLLLEELYCWVFYIKLYGILRNLKNDGWYYVYIGKLWWIFYYFIGINLIVMIGV